MVLSQQEETRLIEKYDKLVWNTVHKFKRRMASSHDNKDDLYQEAVMVLLNHIRSSKTEEELCRIPIRDMINAMCRYVMGEQVVTIPKRTCAFKASIENVAKAADYTELDQDDRYRDSTIDEAMDVMVFNDFIKSLNQMERRIVEMKQNGLTNREVSVAIGVTDVVISRAIKRIKKAYVMSVAA